jgi:hypothetical protein
MVESVVVLMIHWKLGGEEVDMTNYYVDPTIQNITVKIKWFKNVVNYLISDKI